MNPMVMQGLLAQPANAPAQPVGAAPPMPGGMGPQQLQQIYGLLAENTENPTALMLDYVGRMQNQQRLAQKPSSGADLPSNWQEWMLYRQLPEDQQKAYLEMKRGQQLATFGGNKVRVFGDYTADDIYSSLSNEMRAATAMKGADQIGLAYGKKWDILKSGSTERRENYASAQRMLEKVKRNDLPTGLYTGLVYKVLPTEDQEELDALAEFVARSRLKASGEIRPTDADVQGMKRALFGSSTTEGFTRRSLERLVREIESQEHEFSVLSDYFGMPDSGSKAGQLSTPGTQSRPPGLLEIETGVAAPPEPPKPVDIRNTVDRYKQTGAR